MKLIHTAGLIAGAGLLAASIAAPAAASTAKPIDRVLPTLSTAFASTDSVPDVVDLDGFGIRAEDVRSVGSDAVADYWVARQGSENVCLIVHIRGGNEVSSASCTTIADFNLSGLSLVTGEDRTNPDRSSEAYYLPADVATSAITGSDTTGRSVDAEAQLIAGRPGELDLHATKVARDDGAVFSFNPLGALE